ncbi:MAG: aminopeptidase [Clostridiales bacterium]|nr:aminopeptidase [Clostridiales bacterium]
MSESNQVKELKEKLLLPKKHAVMRMSEAQVQEADAFCEAYKEFLMRCKTEREVAAYVERRATEQGFVPFDRFGGKLEPGSKVILNQRGKAIILAVIGKHSAAEGVRITAAHIDSPRIDLKPHPLYEEKEMAYFKTHYYGGIKKYQWTAIPLSLHGRIVRADGTHVDVNLGEAPGEPKFVITDLLPHLSTEQNQKKLSEAILGEDMNILVGSRPFRDDEASEKVKLNIMCLLHEKYGITEADLVSAELEMVPAFTVDDIGFDRSLIGGYGHDDRVCAYTAIEAAFRCGTPEYTAVTVLADKEEVGSDGNTGMNSSFLRYFIADLGRLEGVEARDVLRNSQCMSADVNAAFDPIHASVFEPNNVPYMNHGVVVTKYTGSRGKAGTSDASAEYVSTIRRLLDSHNIQWQTGELGRVDAGGGGTVAMYIANLDVDVVDVGVPVLSMHAPYEIVSKTDVYMAYQAFLAFFE